MKINLNEELNNYNKTNISDEISHPLFYLVFLKLNEINKYKNLLNSVTFINSIRIINKKE
jgi:hypothetical protein